MAEENARQMWNHTASILCLLANLHRDPKKHRAFKPSDFSPIPTRPVRTVRDSETGFRLMKAIFVKKDH